MSPLLFAIGVVVIVAMLFILLSLVNVIPPDSDRSRREKS